MYKSGLCTTCFFPDLVFRQDPEVSNSEETSGGQYTSNIPPGIASMNSIPSFWPCTKTQRTENSSGGGGGGGGECLCVCAGYDELNTTYARL